MPLKTDRNKFYLEGRWKNNADNLELVGDKGKILIKYSAKKINLVAGSPEPKEITVILDGEKHKIIEISDFDLYRLAEMDDYAPHTLELEIPKGVMAYTFTFG